MKVGVVGLGRMGGGIVARLRQAGHEVFGYDTDPSRRDVDSLEDLARVLEPPRVVWVMVPAGTPTQLVIDDLSAVLRRGDVIVDGGNSYYRDSLRRAGALAGSGLHFVDAGTSGGLWGLQNGYCIMAGGSDEAFEIVEPVLEALTEPGGYAHVGPVGTGHYAKMVHNGIEYGMLQAYAEGFNLLEASGFGYDLRGIARLWNHGSVVRSWLLELAEQAFSGDPDLKALHGYVEDSGEGRWTLQEGIERAVPLNVIGASLFARFASRDPDAFAMRFIAALRREFGGHPVRNV